MKPLYLLFICAILFISCASENQDNSQNRKPNIIYILADDLGYGDLSSYGQTKFTTPNIDKLAEQGIKFTQHYSGSTVCAPSRSSLMTGLHTGHTPIRGNKEWQHEGQWPIDSTAYTIAEMMKEAGYVTGAFGKWGLGYPGSEGDPNNQGFDEFFGYNCQRMAHNYYPYHLWHNQEKVMLDGNKGKERGNYAPEVIQQHALEFIEKNKDKEFFMFYPSVIPHAELLVPEDYLSKYRDKFLPEKAYKGVDDGEGLKLGAYGSQPESHAAFAAMVTYLDDQVGEIVAKLRELRIADNTVIMFSSDNGPHLEGGADPDYFDSNGILKGYKRDVYEGGIRVPMIVSWPGKVDSGAETEHISAFWDVMPTLADIVGVKAAKGIDGISFLPTLLNEQQEEHDYLYWEFHERGGRQAIRQGDWKLVKYDVFSNPEKLPELYDLGQDPGEENDLASKYPEKVEELMTIMTSSRIKSQNFPFGDE